MIGWPARIQLQAVGQSVVQPDLQPLAVAAVLGHAHQTGRDAQPLQGLGHQPIEPVRIDRAQIQADFGLLVLNPLGRDIGDPVEPDGRLAQTGLADGRHDRPVGQGQVALKPVGLLDVGRGSARRPGGAGGDG